MKRVRHSSRRVIETHCTIEIEQTRDVFHAHLILDGDVEISPGDRVQVHGGPVRVGYGESRVERRRATVQRANWLQRAWTMFCGRFALNELYDVSFTSKRTL